jgi:CubicO group peptidase (beta-lactamase class C family)
MKYALLIIIITWIIQPTYCQDITTVFPDKDWQSIDNAEQLGWDKKKLNDLRNFIIDSANTTGMLVIYHGKILFQYGNIKDNSYMASCRKSILSMLYGPYVENGKINLEKTIGELGLDDVGGLLPIEKEATIRNLLTARSGVYHPASNEGDQSNMAPERGTIKPGSYFLYNNWDFNAAGYILEKVAGKNIYDIVDSVLSRPLMMQDWDRSIQRKYGDSTKSKFPAYHMWFSTRDMARLGYLMLRNGNWNGKQILASDWVKKITTPVTTYDEALRTKTNYFQFSYGYLWWIWDSSFEKEAFRNGYSATGAFGQFITVLPALDLVVAHKTNYDDYQRSTSTDLYLRILDKLIAARIY